MKLFIPLVCCSLISFTVLAKKGNQKMTADEVIRHFNLRPLPQEGGFYRETYRSDNPGIPSETFGIDSSLPRNISTAIYFLVTPDNFSALHRVKSDEIFHFYGGDPVDIIQIDEMGNLKRSLLGNNFKNGEIPQIIIPKGFWQGLQLAKGGSWALMGTTVAPGFEFEDLEVVKQNEMLKLYPQHHEEIKKFTRNTQ